uniref:Uncharacterized protein n=1 Tax=Romanomermis culicivorax TaxID=13658 RepID=A0A915JBZ7_ROMCU
MQYNIVQKYHTGQFQPRLSNCNGKIHNIPQETFKFHSTMLAIRNFTSEQYLVESTIDRSSLRKHALNIGIESGVVMPG